MKLSSKIEACGFSPIHKYMPLAAKAEQDGKRVFYLNVGQPDMIPPTGYFQAVRNYRPQPMGYAPSAGIPELIEQIRHYYSKLNVSLSADDVLVTTGATEALQIAMSCILDNGDEIIIPEPLYPNYRMFINLLGASVCPLQTNPDKNYHFAVREQIESCINEHTKAILFSNPANPTGSVLREEDLHLIAEIAREHDLFVISDEVYREFVYDMSPPSSILRLSGFEDNLVVLDSISKRFSACGARVGCLLSRNRKLMFEAMKWCQGRMSVATLEQLAAAEAYAAPDIFVDLWRQEYQTRRDAVLKRLHEIPGVIAFPPQGAFYIMVKLPIDDTERFQKWLLTEFDDHGDTLMLAPGEMFYITPDVGKNEARLAYVLPQDDLERAIDVLGAAIIQYRKQYNL